MDENSLTDKTPFETQRDHENEPDVHVLYFFLIKKTSNFKLAKV